MKTKTKSPKESVLLTLAAIRPAKGKEPTQYLFNEMQRIFVLGPSDRDIKETSKLLDTSLEKKLPVKAFIDSSRDVVQKIVQPTAPEIDEFKRARILLEKPERPIRINLHDIDTTKFNIADLYLKIPVFKLCTKIIPDYATAKKIFDFCAKQSCNLPGPYGVSPCIPFQYVRDGCYARAHKMRWIITTKFGYCCEKVFSFANQNNDRLSVKADKWGGCCVTWWYHVAPLVRVKVKFGTLSLSVAMVIDPGMFDKPVHLNTWLSAQENTPCNSNAHVSMYSIQAGSAYSPANYGGTAYTTDPNYTATDATLTAYRNLTTCP